MRTYVGRRALAAAFLVFGAAAGGRAKSESKAIELRRAMDKLWEDHVTWTRLYIVSALANLPDKQATTERLLRNQVDIGNAVKPFYGDAAGDSLTGLLKDHILISADVVAAAAANDSAKLDDANARWRANANQIADFLATANSNWPSQEMRKMMREHLDLTTNEAVARIKKDWNADVDAYEKVHKQILAMAEMLSTGIIRQFPEKFGLRKASSK